MPKASLEVAEELADFASPMKLFVDERLAVMPEGGSREDYTVEVGALLSEYNSLGAHKPRDADRPGHGWGSACMRPQDRLGKGQGPAPKTADARRLTPACGCFGGRAKPSSGQGRRSSKWRAERKTASASSRGGKDDAEA